MAPTSPKVAFVAGCNGVTGNAIVEHLIRQPKEEWSHIIISSRSPLKNFWQDSRVDFVALDFLEPVEALVAKMAPMCGSVTHAYFTSYVHTDDFTKLRDYNVPLFKNFLTALDTVAGSSLQRVCLQTGGKHYGVHLGPVPNPCRETDPRYKDNGLNFYYPQEDFMFELSEKRNWSWNVIRPNGIIGFTPGKNGMSGAITLALYMLVCKELGEVPRFPGNKYFYNCVDDSSYAPNIADMSVWATTHEHTKNEAFNSVNGDTIVWRYHFQNLGKYFGIDIPEQTEFSAAGEGTQLAHSFRMEDWAKDKKPVWEKICEKYGGDKNAFDWGSWFFFDWTLGKAWPTLSSLTKARSFGWTRYDDTLATWIDTFKALENGGVLPKNRVLLAGSQLGKSLQNGSTSNGVA
ncbi:hypothetical protein LTR10_021690 [Elasticomyces elasticus]|uniref:PRISE-like Rossmann-fold domain-containing protein n=1 Tax=Exophiala sideris TaxID=1016849 RepID=A0ABR0IUT1_9EURO|nr:hypothetical protein LTR10_021690 [Elasticomyces elasticus]KAK5021135.1 hypothetical protein LTS07_011222 [Exophiala sideris]KAK5023746.1 hypothetical protein LTR13_011124 [Exophiala sideris]KAK5048825.1 hypothetical protein LTR69_011239 [Exophiala sideris]KAK5176314.1 hypothetical protein LTR44_011145 [Eurotiomycetes sp. CCFEE 6388]